MNPVKILAALYILFLYQPHCRDTCFFVHTPGQVRDTSHKGLQFMGEEVEGERNKYDLVTHHHTSVALFRCTQRNTLQQ